MQSMVRQMLKYIFSNRVAQKFAKNFVIQVAKTAKLDLLSLAYSQIGILNYRNASESGEHYLISTWLKSFLEATGIDQPCFFDVGANIGYYSESLLTNFPSAKIFAFEPNPDTFQTLNMLSQKKPNNIRTFNTALGATIGDLEFYIRNDNASSSHATFYQDVLTNIHHYDDVRSFKVPVDTIDHFCFQNHVERIDLLKIDTEGHEVQVLQGAKNALETGIVRSIQFEFNEMNIYSRSFLWDFVEILNDFNLYRLLPTSLLPIHYDSRHEIFLFQNFLAIRNDQDSLLVNCQR
ncbi:MAG: FkbM family methyltransferase [Chloroflexi bacterium]|nr:FkbM family methyltransferase [Chloroflexota bacterium]